MKAEVKNTSPLVIIENIRRNKKYVTDAGLIAVGAGIAVDFAVWSRHGEQAIGAAAVGAMAEDENSLVRSSYDRYS